MKKLILAVAALVMLSLGAPQAHAVCLKHVFVFDAYWCSFCKRTKDFLARHGIPYDSVDIEVDRRYRSTMEINFGNASVPVIVIDGRWDHATLRLTHGWVVRGFKEHELRQLLCITD